MKATFADFIKNNPNCSKFNGNADAMSIFELLSRDLSIILMIEASDAGKPALTPWAKHVEHVVQDSKMRGCETLSLDDNFTKQAIGLMVKCILEPFGYGVWKQKDLPKSAESTKFQSASVYRRDPTKTPTLRVAKYIEEVQRNDTVKEG